MAAKVKMDKEAREALKAIFRGMNLHGFMNVMEYTWERGDGFIEALSDKKFVDTFRDNMGQLLYHMVAAVSEIGNYVKIDDDEIFDEIDKYITRLYRGDVEVKGLLNEDEYMESVKASLNVEVDRDSFWYERYVDVKPLLKWWWEYDIDNKVFFDAITAYWCTGKCNSFSSEVREALSMIVMYMVFMGMWRFYTAARVYALELEMFRVEKHEYRYPKLVGGDGQILKEWGAIAVPRGWSERAAMMAVDKYMRPGERSVYHLVSRVVYTLIWRGPMAYRYGSVVKALEEDPVAQKVNEALNAIRSLEITGDDTFMFSETDDGLWRDIITGDFRGRKGGAEYSFNFYDGEKTALVLWYDLVDDYTDDSEFISLETLYMALIRQEAAFNSPVWFNLYPANREIIGSACFVFGLEDDLDDIRKKLALEAKVYSHGSGVGINYGKLRETGALLSGGGSSSGPLSFMEISDSVGNVVKSGGRNRRAAKMNALDVDHPDIRDFIHAKRKEERKAWALIDWDREHGGEYGWGEGGLDSEAYRTVKFQNSNFSVVVTDEFMRRVEEDGEWEFKTRGHVEKEMGKEVVDVVKARELFKEIAESAWECADPGLMFIDRINEDNMIDSIEKIRGSNPCLVGDTLLLNNGKLVRIDEGIGKENDPDWEWYSWFTGEKETIKLVTNAGHEIVLTPDHPVRLANGEFIEAKDTLGKEIEWGVGNLNFEGKVVLEAIEDYEEARKIQIEWQAQGGYAVIREYEDEKAYYVIVYDYKPFELKVIDIEESGIRKVYDFRMKEGDPWNFANGFVCHNCGEFTFVDDSACNLGSINLDKFYGTEAVEHGFDTEFFRDVVYAMIWAMDIVVDLTRYPYPLMRQKSVRYRPLGLGYTNLGRVLIRMWKRYGDSDAVEWVEWITSVMTTAANYKSAVMGRQYGRLIDADGRIEVERVRQVVNSKVKEPSILKDIRIAAQVWNDFVPYIRNAAVTLLAPTGTISFLMDAETTGIEPLFAVVAYKSLVGGGVLKMVSDVVKEYIKEYYDEEKAVRIIDKIEETGSVRGVGLSELDEQLFDTALDGLTPKDHIDIQAAAQKYLSLAISKTINLPAEYTVEDVMDTYMYAWKAGLKGITVYRSGSKRMEVLTTKKSEDEDSGKEGDQRTSAGGDIGSEREGAVLSRSGSRYVVPWPLHEDMRRRLPDTRAAITHKFEIMGEKGYLTVGFYDDGSIGEVFIKMNKEGSLVSGLMDTIGTLTSIALQHGIPVDELERKMRFRRFDPMGYTSNPEIREASSVVDYIFRYLRLLQEKGYIKQYIREFVERDGILEIVEERIVKEDCDEGAMEDITGDTVEAGDGYDEYESFILDEMEHGEAVTDITTETGADMDGEALDDSDRVMQGVEIKTALEGESEGNNGGKDNGNNEIDYDDYVICQYCGNKAYRMGHCYTCLTCGETTGCS